MKIVGITGGIGSGKSTIANFFNELFNIPVYYADAEAKVLMNTVELKEQVIKLLGENSYKNGKLDRAFVASLVFKDSELLSKLNAIVHPAVKIHFEAWCGDQEGSPYVLKEAAILFENGGASQCDYTILVIAPTETRIKRVLSRDSTTRAEIEDRMSKQWDDSKKIPLADFIIENIDLEESRKKTAQIHSKLVGSPINT